MAGCTRNNKVLEERTDDMDYKINITINNYKHEVILDKNETTREFLKILPKEYDMKDLNNNEKYVYIDDVLPKNEQDIGHIEKGDIMLYQNNCIVIFYKSFDTTYKYTKIGNINNLQDLQGSSIKVKFER